MLFVKAAKVVALSITFLPLTGCAIGTGLIFASLLKSLSYAPDSEESLFSYAALGFAFVETFALMLFAIGALVYAF
jgi:F0F1-type ATP synthase membrane subunit c/vacuolar-type H+-ATPase subunit K